MTGFKKVKAASAQIAALVDRSRAELLLDLADEIESGSERLLTANAEDLARMSPENPLYDRLMLSESRLHSIAEDMRRVAGLPSPTGRILLDKIMPNGLRLRKITVPFGVVGVVYEARPNVTFDVFSLCFKSGNACVLKGGKDADASNRAAVGLIKGVLQSHGVTSDAVMLMSPTHEAVSELLSAVGDVDLVIPRGGRRLIEFVRDNAKVPVIETGAGVVNTYFDAAGDLEIGRIIINNAKTRRVSVCNALDCLIIHELRLGDLPTLVEPLSESGVLLFADGKSFATLDGRYPSDMLQHAGSDSFGTEYMDYKMSIKTVGGIEEALSHISQFGSGHSECIITEDVSAAEQFRRRVDAACVYVNAPTSFTDGGQFGLGAEIGISTQKLGARGPMGLEEMTTYKWLIDGHGQVRE